jgi:predicted acetyltransferase
MTALRSATPGDFDAVSKLMFLVFNHAVDPALDEIERPLYEPERALVVTDGDEIVGHASSYGRELTVPGGVVPAAHVTGVGVAPTHRRRGLLRSLMERQLRDLAEPLAVLWASEGRIYPRFGYGLAAPRLALAVDSAEVGGLPASGGRLSLADPAAVRPTLTKLFDQARLDRPGWSGRDERWWQYLLADLESRRDGATERRAVLHEGADGAVDGYALYRVRSRWEDGSPRGEVRVQEVVTLDGDAYRALWDFLLSVDLTRQVTHDFATPDEPLQHLVAEPRRLGATFADGLWVRVLDVAGALSARRYAAPVDVVLEVTDDQLPGNGGRWHLVGSPSSASCSSAGTREADISLSVTDLGAVYLGGVGLTSLAAAGRVRELRPGTLSGADLAFRWHRAPGSVEVF